MPIRDPATTGHQVANVPTGREVRQADRKNSCRFVDPFEWSRRHGEGWVTTRSQARWPARSWSPACWDRPRACGWPAPSRTRSTASVGRWRRCASPPDWRRCCLHTSPKPGGSSWSGRRLTSRIAASSRRDASQRAEARVPLYWLLSGESDCGTLMLTLAIGGDADAESPPAAPHAEPIEADGKGLVGTI